MKKRKKYYEKEEQNLHVYNPKIVPYKILKDLTEPERPKAWSVQSMRPNSSDFEIAWELADFFSRITDTLPPLRKKYGKISEVNECPTIETSDVRNKLKNIKKPKSVVRGDI